MNVTNPSLNPNPPQYDTIDSKSGLLNSVPAWGSYLYQNFLLPAFSPSEWLNNNTPSAMLQQPQQPQNMTMDYFSQGQGWAALTSDVKVEPLSQQPAPTFDIRLLPQPNSTSHQPIMQQQSVSGQTNFYPEPYYYNPSLPTSLLMSQSTSSHNDISPSIDVVDTQIIRSPSPLSSQVSPHHSPKTGGGGGGNGCRSHKRRASSMESDLDDEHENDHEVPEGVERDGMIWGMKVEDYRALSARERKRVRNRISARTFRAKRKEHLTSLESTLGAKDLQIRLANEEAARLKREVMDLKRRLAKYERS